MPLARLIFALAASALAAPALATTYKWVDDNGVTHYSDRIPPQYKDKGGYELNKRGVVIKKIDPAVTAEQRRAKEEEAVRQAADEQRVSEQRRKDAALLNTYTSEKEIEQKRDRDLRQVELALNDAQTNLRIAQGRLELLRKQAGAEAPARKSATDPLADDIAKAEADKKQLEILVNLKRQEMESIRVKYDEYRRRFAELKKSDGPTPR